MAASDGALNRGGRGSWESGCGWQVWALLAFARAYLRVVTPGHVRAGDAIEVLDRPDYDVDIGHSFRALTKERDLLPRRLEAGEGLEPELRELTFARRGVDLEDEPAIDQG